MTQRYGYRLPTDLEMEQRAEIERLRAENAELREALDRQCDNVAFILNRVELHGWAEKFALELEADRTLVASKPGERT